MNVSSVSYITANITLFHQGMLRLFVCQTISNYLYCSFPATFVGYVGISRQKV